jgi:UDP-3-O-[3-hydroxymyristoyl] glucosamine N-acyltransferase
VNYTLKNISKIFNAELIGDEDYSINQVSSIVNASEKSIVFFSSKKYLESLKKSKAKVVITTKELSKFCNHNIIISENPYVLFAKISQLLNKKKDLNYRIHSSLVSYSENLSKKIVIDPNVVIGENVHIGDNSFIGANCSIGDNVEIMSGAYIFPNVTIYKNVNIGENVIIHSGTVIGSDGFGYANENNSWIKIPQIGGVEIGNNVEIGSNTSIDRGALDNTVIGDGVKIDNQIQIAHNVQIGENTAIAGCVGIAGSAKIGKNCTIGGGAGIQGHINICDNSHITGMTKVSSDIKKPGIYTSGTPLMLNKDWLKNAARFKKLNELFIKNKN